MKNEVRSDERTRIALIKALDLAPLISEARLRTALICYEKTPLNTKY
jgi:hypothetical protein